jgi:hypothetical protein
MDDTSNPIRGIYLNYAMRALLGGGGGKFVMSQLKDDNPGATCEIGKPCEEKAL